MTETLVSTPAHLTASLSVSPALVILTQWRGGVMAYLRSLSLMYLWTTSLREDMKGAGVFEPHLTTGDWDQVGG